MVIRYVLIVAVIAGMFVNFIACGAKMYQVSLRHDMPEGALSEDALDPSSPFFGIHAPDGWQSLPVKFRLDKAIADDRLEGLLKAMRTWEMATGRKLFTFIGYDDKTGDSFKDLYGSLPDMVNGHYFDDDWSKTKKPEEVLATTIWDTGGKKSIETADIRFNNEYYNIGDAFKRMSDGKREVVDMESLALHELGHLLGLAHIPESYDKYSIMNPSLFIGEALANRTISLGDVKRIQKIYGCEGLACDQATTLKRIAAFSTKPMTVADLVASETGYLVVELSELDDEKASKKAH